MVALPFDRPLLDRRARRRYHVVREVAPWDTSVREVREIFLQAVGQDVTVTGPHWAPGRHKAGTRTGWVDAVSAHGWVFALEVPGAWGQDPPAVIRTFVSWTDLWADEDRTMLSGTWMLETALGPQTVDIGAWVSEWNARGRLRLPIRHKK